MGVSEVFFKTGRKITHADLTRFIPVHNVVCKLNEEQTHILLSVYVLTGCDTCCALFGIGKKTALKTMMTYSAELQGLADIGKEHSLSLTARLACVSFVCLLYGCNGCLSLNKLRVNRVLENKKVKPRKPTDDSFILHVLRCSYQIMIWMESLTSIVELPSPTDYGYEIDTDTGHYIPTLVSQPLAPPVSVKIFVVMPVFVPQVSNPVLKLAIVHVLKEFVRMSSQFFQLLKLKI